MQFISNIPFAVLINIGFMAMLYLAYVLFKYFMDLSAKQLFNIAVGFEFIGLVQFIGSLIFYSNSSIYNSPYVLINFSIPFSQWNQHTVLVYLGLVYFVFLFVFFIRAINQLNKLNQIRNTSNYSNATYWNQHIQSSFQFDKQFKIGVSDAIDSPLTFGWLDPIILLPISLCNQLSIEETKVILLHEIAHISRQDYIVNLLVTIIHTILYFNPISYLFIKEINIQREMACDSWVLAHSNNPIQYSKLLFTIANHKMGALDNKYVLNFITKQNELLNRIKKINQLSVKSNNALFQSISLALFLIVTSTLFVFITINPIAYKSLKIDYTKNTSPKLKSNSTNFSDISIAPIVHASPKSTININKVANNNSVTILEMESKNSELSNYNKVVDQTLQWLKQHENMNQFANYDLKKDSIEYDFAEKLVLRSILKSYQFKKDILNAKMTEATNQKEAYDFIMNSKEWNEIQRYELWTKEFLLQHPGTFTTIDSTQLY
jgi:beta-lactamase regulating signal transducer with metallopeptidase domain